MLGSLSGEELRKRIRREFLRDVKSGHGKLNARGRDLLQSTNTNGESWSVSKIYQMEKLLSLETDINAIRGMNIDISNMPRYKSNTPRIPDEINVWSNKAIDIVSLRRAWEIKTFNYNIPEQNA